MGSLALLVDRRGSRLELGANETLVVRRTDGSCERVGLRALGEVLLFGEVALDSRVLRALADAGVGLCCLPLRGLGGSALLLGPPTQGANLRHAQHCAFAQPRLRLELARLAVLHKLTAMELVAQQWGQEVDEAEAASGKAAAENAIDIASLMGVEGAATKRHLDLFRAALPASFTFAQRLRRPPPDPINALMSLCYTLAQTPAAQMLVRAGLDPQIGFLHGALRDRPALVLDLIEAARPHADAFVIELVANGALQPADFYFDVGKGMRLGATGRRHFYARWFASGITRVRGPMRALLSEWQTRLHRESARATSDAPAET